MKNSLKSGDLVAAVEDGVELITGYWGGTKADWASEQVLRVFSGLVRKKEKKYNLLRDRVLAQMLKCDGFRLKDWAKRIYYRGYYEQAVHLAAKAREKLKGLPDSTEATLFLGRAAVGAGDYDVAQKAFRELYTRHGGTREAEQAMFRQGLVLLRREKYGAAVAVFERLLAANNDSNFDLQARYWMWRGLQLNKSEKATAAARDLIKRYPLTYYGLRARAETNSGKLAWFDNGKEQIEVELVLSDVERLSWEKFEILLRAGWFEEAQDELKFLPAPMSPEEKLIYSRLNSLAFDYYNGTKLIHEAWDEDESLMTKSYLHLAYPREFLPEIKDYAKKNNVDPYLVMSLIKQESSYRPKAVSPSNAHGLMQLMPVTARETAKRVKIKRLRIPEDLFNPETNIRLGTSYLRQMIRAFNGHVPLALAAYNAGIGRIRLWTRARPELSSLAKENNSEFLNEIWIDELPWSETSFYVKAILRNFLVYQMLDNGDELALSRPIWKQGLKSGNQ